MSRRPVLHLIAGPNGAGKTTLYETTIKPRFPTIEFVNADVMAKAEYGHNARTAEEVKFGQAVAQARRDELLKNGTSLVAETVFSHPSKVQLVQHAQSMGHRVWLYHVNVATADQSIKRIGRRVKDGGHDVPEATARARYERNQPLIVEAMRLTDRGFVFDNSAFGQAPAQLVEFRKGRAEKVADDLPTWVTEIYGSRLQRYDVTVDLSPNKTRRR